MEGGEARIAIVGAGPAGFYCAERLLKRDDRLRIDLVDRLPTPFGLVRGGVAPDHPKIKTVCAVFDRIARNPRVAYLGNVTLGRDIGLEDLLPHYHATILATGAPQGAALGIPGEGLRGVHGAGELVGWYNGHPDYRDLEPDLDAEAAVVIGHGNVAADICRMLLTPAAVLAATDIARHALERLAASRVRTVHLVGRRGVAQAKFSNNELRELGEIADCDVVVEPEDLLLGAACRREVEHPDGAASARNVAIAAEFAARPRRHARSLHIHFCRSPTAILGTDRVAGIELARNALAGEPFAQRAIPASHRETIDCGLVVGSVGFRALPVAGAPFDARRGIVPHVAGHVDLPAGSPGALFVAGWVKRGATGIIGTNRADAIETADSLLARLPQLASQPRPGGDALRRLLGERGVAFTDYADWDALDRCEIALGASCGKPREKLTRIQEMLARVRPA